MNDAGQKAANPRLVGWLGWAGLDAVSRLALMTGSTIVFSRILAPHDFGVTALVLTIVTTAAIFVGTPFEEALTQRRYLRMAHLRAALGASWLIAVVILGISVVAGHWLARMYGEPEIAALLPVAMASIFFSGHSDIVTALARRLRRFNEVAYATMFGHLIGVGCALVIAFMGYGLWALVAQRLLVVVARAVILQWRIGILITPTWSSEHIGELGRFAGVSFLSRLTDNLTYLAFNNLVQAFYGVSMLGQVNMAMRLIEPIRGAIMATGHNLAFTFFARAGHDVDRLRRLADDVISQSAFATVPVFVGMAAIAPVLTPLVAGPGWTEAADIAVCLSLASAMAIPSNLFFTAFSASARPQYSFYSLLAGFAAIVLVLCGFSWLGPISVGLSRIAGDLIRAGFAVCLPLRGFGWTRRARLSALAPAWMLGAIMGVSVAVAGVALAGSPMLVKLAAMVAFGIAVYAALLAIFARPQGVFFAESLHLTRLPTWRLWAR